MGGCGSSAGTQDAAASYTVDCTERRGSCSLTATGCGSSAALNAAVTPIGTPSGSSISDSDEIVGGKCEESCSDQSNENPRFQFFPGALSEEEIHGIQSFADENLGLDESSVHFMRRRKAIAFVFVLHGKVYSLEQNYFVQNESYNDFSGGIRRPFAKISDDFLQKNMHAVIMRFAEYNKIPDKAIMQIQTSECDKSEETFTQVEEEVTQKSRRRSITGQGIHTDGHEKAMLACIRRNNVTGAENQYFADLDGNQPLCQPRILQEGDISFFTDNELYHYVSSAGPAVPTEDMARTMLLMHYPAEDVLVGVANPNNNGGTRKSDIKLRESKSDIKLREQNTKHRRGSLADALSYPKL